MTPTAFSSRMMSKDLLDDERGQADGRLVHEQNPRASHEPPGDGEHLLLAARQGAGKLTLAFFQAGKAPVDVRDVGRDLRRGSPSRVRAGVKVLLHVHARKHQTVLRHQCDAPGHHPGGRQPGQVLAVQDHGAGLGGENPRDGEHGRGLAGAVGAEQARDLAFGRVEADASQRLDVPIGRDQVSNAQHGLRRSRRPGGTSSWMSRGRPPARPCPAALRPGCRRRSCARS